VRRIGVLTGLAVETRILKQAAAGPDASLLVACAGADAERARREAEALVAAGADALLSFGLAGGLDPRLRPGDMIYADRVVLPEGRMIDTDAGWRRTALARLRAAGIRAIEGPIAGSPQVLATPQDKQRLAERSGALAVDTESSVVAETADRSGLPFLAIRAIADPAWLGLPSIALIPLRPDGRIQPRALTRGLVSRPGEWLQVLRLALDTRAGLAALGRVARAAPLLP
jgi:adenosylhomocysteine nucleosidase